MSRYYQHNPDSPIIHDHFTGGTVSKGLPGQHKTMNETNSQPIPDGTTVWCIVNETTTPRIIEAEALRFAIQRPDHGSTEYYSVRESDELGIRYHVFSSRVFTDRELAKANLAETIKTRIKALEYEIKTFKTELEGLKP